MNNLDKLCQITPIVGEGKSSCMDGFPSFFMNLNTLGEERVNEKSHSKIEGIAVRFSIIINYKK